MRMIGSYQPFSSTYACTFLSTPKMTDTPTMINKTPITLWKIPCGLLIHFVKIDNQGNKVASYVAYKEPQFSSVERELLR